MSNVRLYEIKNGDIISLSVKAYKSQFDLISSISRILEGNIKYGIQYSSLENIIKIMITNIESH